MAVSTQTLDSLRSLVCDLMQESLQPASVDEVEEVVEAVRRVCSEAAQEVLLRKLTGRSTYKGVSLPCPCGSQARFVAYRKRWVKTAYAETQVERAYYHCGACRRGQAPWDTQQGLNARVWSAKLKGLVCQLCAHLPYETATSLLERTGCVRVEESSAEAIVLEVGARLREQEEQARLRSQGTEEQPALAVDAGERSGRLYIGIDAAKAHIDRAWHDVKVAALFEGQLDKEGRDHPVRTEYVAAQEACEGFGWRVYGQARERGLERFAECVVIGDGAEFIWNQACFHFPRATQVLDYWHASEHIWSLSRTLYGEGSEQGKRWAKERARSLKEDGPVPLLRALKRRRPGTAPMKEALRLETAYFQKNRQRMNYPRYRSRGMMIGSGPVEAGCKTVVCQRMKQAGMRWSRDGADAMLAVRTATLSNQWNRIQECAHIH